MRAAQRLAGHEALQALDAEGELAQGEVALGFHVALAEAVEEAAQQPLPCNQRAPASGPGLCIGCNKQTAYCTSSLAVAPSCVRST